VTDSPGPGPEAGTGHLLPLEEDPFPPGFFSRQDETDDADFYVPLRLVTHIDDRAIAAVGALYDELGIDGEVLDLMSSWISHFSHPADRLVALGMNAEEMARNPMATDFVVHDLNADPTLPFPDESFDDVVCCVSIDYLTRPVEVLRDVGRVLRPGGRFVTTFSNRCFPMKAIRGWLMADDRTRVGIVGLYYRQAGCYERPFAQLRTPSREPGDPLYAVWATVRKDDGALPT
jgi:SAM-dependent methyltransferase